MASDLFAEAEAILGRGTPPAAMPVIADNSMGDTSGGLRRGLRSAGAGFNRIAGTAAEAAGFNDFAARRIAAAQAADAANAADPAKVSSYKDVISAPDLGTGLRRAVDYGTNMIGESLPALGAMAVGGLVGGTRGAALAMTPFSMGDVAARQEADPVASQESAGLRLGKQALFGGVDAALNTIVPAGVAGRVLGKAAGAAAKAPVSKILGQVGVDAATQGAAGAAGEAAKQLGVNPDKPLDMGQIAEVGVGGTALGAAMGGVGAAGTLARKAAGAPGRGVGAVVDAVGASKPVEAAKKAVESYDLGSISKGLQDVAASAKDKTGIFLGKVAAGDEHATVDPSTYVGKTPEEVQALQPEQESKRAATLTEIGKGLMARASEFTAEAQTKLREAMANPTDPRAQAVIAKVKVGSDAVADFASKAASAAQAFAADMTTPKGVKKSEDYSGADKALMEHVLPILQEARPELFEVGLPRRAMQDAAGTIRMLLDHVNHEGSTQLPDAKLAKAMALLGDRTTDVLLAAQKALHSDKATSEALYRVLNRVEESQGRDKGLRDTLNKSLVEANTLNQDQLDQHVALLRAYAGRSARAERGAAPGDKEADLFHERRINQLLDEHYGKNKDAVLKAVEKDRKAAEKYRNQFDDGTETVDGADRKLSDEVLAEDKDPTERKAVEATPDPVYRGVAGKDEVMLPSPEKAVGKGEHASATEQAMEKMRREYPDRNVTFLRASEIGDHPAKDRTRNHLEMKAAEEHPELSQADRSKLVDAQMKDHGFVVAEGTRQETAMTDKDLPRVRLKRPEGSSADYKHAARVDVGGEVLDAIKLSKWAEARNKTVDDYSNADNKSARHRAGRMFMEGLAAAQARIGKPLKEVPDATQIGWHADGKTPLLWGEVKGLDYSPEKSKAVKALEAKLAAMREEYKTADKFERAKIVKDVQDLIKHQHDSELASGDALPRDAAARPPKGEKYDPFAADSGKTVRARPQPGGMEPVDPKLSVVVGPDGFARTRGKEAYDNRYDADGRLTDEGARILMQGDVDGGMEVERKTTHTDSVNEDQKVYTSEAITREYLWDRGRERADKEARKETGDGRTEVDPFGPTHDVMRGRGGLRPTEVTIERKFSPRDGSGKPLAPVTDRAKREVQAWGKGLDANFAPDDDSVSDTQIRTNLTGNARDKDEHQSKPALDPSKPAEGSLKAKMSPETKALLIDKVEAMQRNYNTPIGQNVAKRALALMDVVDKLPASAHRALVSLLAKGTKMSDVATVVNRLMPEKQEVDDGVVTIDRRPRRPSDESWMDAFEAPKDGRPTGLDMAKLGLEYARNPQADPAKLGKLVKGAREQLAEIEPRLDRDPDKKTDFYARRKDLVDTLRALIEEGDKAATPKLTNSMPDKAKRDATLDKMLEKEDYSALTTPGKTNAFLARAYERYGELMAMGDAKWDNPGFLTLAKMFDPGNNRMDLASFHEDFNPNTGKGGGKTDEQIRAALHAAAPEVAAKLPKAAADRQAAVRAGPAAEAALDQANYSSMTKKFSKMGTTADSPGQPKGRTEQAADGLVGVMRGMGFRYADDPRFVDVASKLLADPRASEAEFIKGSAEALSHLVMQGERGKAIREALQGEEWLPVRARIAADLMSRGMKRGDALVDSYRVLAERALRRELGARHAGAVGKIVAAVREIITAIRGAAASDRFARVVRDQLNATIEASVGAQQLRDGMKRVTFQEAVDGDVQAADVLAHLAKHDDVSLTGSIVLAASGPIYRNAKNMLHDLDIIVRGSPAVVEAHLRKQFPGAVKVYDFKTSNGKVDTFIVPPKGAEVTNLKRVGQKVSSFAIERDGVEIGRTWNESGVEMKEGTTGTLVDLFSGTDDQAVRSIQFRHGGKDHTVRAVDAGSIFDAKLSMGRDKDLGDYLGFVPDVGKKFSRMSNELHADLGRSGFAGVHVSNERHSGVFDWRGSWGKGKGQGEAKAGAGTYLSTTDEAHAGYRTLLRAKLSPKQFYAAKFEQGEPASYHVSVDADKSTIMKWDEAYSAQSDTVKGGLRGAMRELGFKDDAIARILAEDPPAHELYGYYLYNRVFSLPEVSNALQRNGIVGAAYRAARGMDYVIYDDSKITTNYVHFDKTNSNHNAPPRAATADAALNAYIDKVLGPSIARDLNANIPHAGEFVKAGTQHLINISRFAIDPWGTGHHEALHSFFASMREASPTGEVARVLERAASSAPVLNQLKKLLKDHPEALKQLSDPEEAAAYMYQFWAANKLTVGAQTHTIFSRIAAAVRRVLGIWSNDERALHILDYFHRGDFAVDRGQPDVVAQKLLLEHRNLLVDQAAKLTKPLRELSASVAVAGGQQLRDSGIPALVQLADTIKLHGTAEGKDPGYMPAARAEHTRVMNDIMDKLAPFTKEQMREALDAMQQEVRATSKEARHIQLLVQNPKVGLLPKMREYMGNAGVGVSRFGPDPTYFHRVWDTGFITEHQNEFLAMLGKYQISGDLKGDPRAILQRLMATDGLEFRVETNMPGMQALKMRKLDFITGADAEPFLRKDLLENLNSYVQQATRRAEWARRFGDQGEGLQDLLTKAAQQGATPEQLAMAQRYVKSIDGTLGDTIDPKYRRLFGNLMVYQNIRLLPLAIFSSLPDSLGIMVRGGTVAESGRAFMRGMMEIRKNFQKEGGKNDAATDLAELVGTIDSAQLMHAIGTSYSQGMVGNTGRRVNDLFFRYNFMDQYNRSMRVAATEAAISFIKRHADGTANKHSERWLSEIGLEPGKVKMDANGRPDVMDADVRMAINRWVDGAVLRPDAADAPPWMADPRAALISHLKKFTFSFQETILKRVVHEYQHGNYAPAMALTSYVPMMLAADMAKGIIQGGGEEPDWKAGWDAGDYLGHAVQRAGLFGVGQFALDAYKGGQRDGLLGALGALGSLGGPTVGQLVDGVETMAGTQRAGTFLLHSMPANALYSGMARDAARDDPRAD